MQKYLYKDLYQLEESHWWHKNKRQVVSFFIKQHIKSNRDKILDVGCGTGKNIEEFSLYGICWGIDNSSEAIAFCKKRLIKNVVLGSIEKIPFPSKTFDIITALDVLEHVDDKKSLKEIYRVLKQDGILIITVPAFQSLWSKWDEVLHHKRRYTKKSLEKVLEESRFKSVKISYVYSFLILLVFLIRAFKNIFFKDHYPSDFKLSNPVINYLLSRISGFERFFVINANVPFGTSLIAVTKKN